LSAASLTFLGIYFQESFWLWFNRSFQVAFWIYVIAVIYGIYKFIPSVGAILGTGVMQGIQGFFTQQKMTALGEKGVEARQQKAQREGQIALIAADDPMKGMLAPFVGEQIRHSTQIPKALREVFAENAEKMILKNEINLTNWLVTALDKKFPTWGLSEKINALGVITNAEKVE
jgi:hypothetical protein